MREYGEAAVEATEAARSGARQAPEAWEAATRAHFPDSELLRDKTAPRAAFLGLCEAGLVAGVAVGAYTLAQEHKNYALRAVELLAAEPELAGAGPAALWARVTDAWAKPHDSQMDVVLALWRRGLIAQPG